jgi:hypothetical protein
MTATLTTLVSFGIPVNGVIGSIPEGSLIADSSGDLFGTTISGGASADGDGTVYEIVKTAGGYAITPTTLAALAAPTGCTRMGT